MLQAHSFLWNYLWVAPNVYLLVLALLLWRRGLAHKFPAFLAFAVLGAISDLAVFAADIAPFVSPVNYWRVSWAYLLIESVLKFSVIGEALSQILSSYPSLSRLGRTFVSGFGALLVLLAAMVAAFARGDSSVRLISGFHIVEQTVFIVQLGLILSLLLFAAYFRLSWNRLSWGIVLGLGISACGHLVTWALVSNASPTAHERMLLGFFSMATFHLCVLIWFYYLLVPKKVSARSIASPLPETNLDLWNRELERLLQQ